MKSCAVEGTLQAQPWYFGVMNRNDAIEILRNNDKPYPIGTFIIRKSYKDESSKKAKNAPPFAMSIIAAYTTER